ncbi:acyltransferase family protein [Caulobacter hibisci]|uniref:Acyltransferase n=1 Tax=Caulobacter hibisci TaxID=2035993 RepID=A0ABS0T295_9CAUL|nr:acyltransferase [Caulobacter hibisci]MBI1685851.1 acyltransferase [Caulobacter hibisci]
MNAVLGALAALFGPSRQVAHRRSYGPDLLRAAAILLVMAWHMPKPARPEPLLTVQPFGWLGVDVFFVLSGYLIGAQLLKGIAAGNGVDFGRFWTSRAFRILPAFGVVLALYFLLPGFSDGEAIQPLWRFLTFSMNLGLDYRVTGAFTSAWSLCVEEHFYWILPPLVLVLARFKGWGPAVAVGAAVILGGMALRWGIWHGPAADPATRPADFLRLIYYPTWTRLDGLALGVLLAAARTFRPALVARFAPPWLTGSLGLLATAGTVIVCLRHADGVALDLTGAVFLYPLACLASALLLCALLDLEPALQRLPLQPFTAVATLAYSLYLVHKPVQHMLREGLGDGVLHGWTGVAAYLAADFAAAILLWWLVERPFLRLRDRALRRPVPAPVEEMKRAA